MRFNPLFVRSPVRDHSDPCHFLSIARAEPYVIGTSPAYFDGEVWSQAIGIRCLILKPVSDVC